MREVAFALQPIQEDRLGGETLIAGQGTIGFELWKSRMLELGRALAIAARQEFAIKVAI